MDVCIPQIGRFMPPIVRNLLPSLPSTVKLSWKLFTEELLLHFGKPEEEENRELLNKLRHCKQQAGESTRLFSAKWQHLQSLLPEKHLTEGQKISLYTKSIFNQGLRTTLVTFVELGQINTVSDVIKKAIDIEDKARLNEIQPQDRPDQHHTKTEPDDPMDIDYINSSRQFNNHKHRHRSHGNKRQHNTPTFPDNCRYQQPTKYSHNNPTQQQRQHNNNSPPRLYDKQGNPICGYCQQKHRTIDCRQHRPAPKYKTPKRPVHTCTTTETEESTTNTVDLDNPTSINIDFIQAKHLINYMSKEREYTPISTIRLDDIAINALWDTGSAITCMSHDTAQQLNLMINSDITISYTDVNQKTTSTMGVGQLKLFNQTITFHIIKGLARQIIFGFDIMKQWQTVIDTRNKTIHLNINNKKYALRFDTTIDSKKKEVCATTIQEQVIRIVQQHPNVIAKDNDKPTVTHLIEFSIDTGEHDPIYSAPRRYHPEIQKQIDAKFEQLVENGIVKKVTFTEWGSQVTAVAKPNGTLRLCGNYIKLNAITKTIKYPFVNLHQALQSLGQSVIFSKIDLASGYYQIKINESDKVKTALVTTNGTYVFNVMPFGLKNAPAVFQALMDRVLGNLRYRCAIAYLDDIIIYSANPSKHMQDVEEVLKHLEQANLSINPNKSFWALKSIESLGFIISDQGISANPEKIKPILALEPPKDIKALERFLGLAGVYQKFINNFQVIVEPLRRLKKKDAKFEWTNNQQQAFENIKKQLANLPLLKQPDFTKQFELHCDAATKAGIGVVLCQRYNDVPYPLSFASRALTKQEQKYSARELEALAVLFGIKKHRIYLEAGHFKVFTDHSSLQWLLSTNQDKQPRLWRWCLFLQAYDFEVIYIPGKKNKAADALSRDSATQDQVIAAIDTNDWTNMSWWKQEQQQDQEISQVIKNIKDGTHGDNTFQIKDGILYKVIRNKNNIKYNNIYKVLPKKHTTEALNRYHDSRFAGHGGANKTKKLLNKARIWWKTMDQEIVEHTKSCQLCQKVKGNKSHIYPMSNTSSDLPFKKVSMDYFGPLPKTENGNQYILVIIDTFTRYVEIYPVRTTQASELAQVFYYQFTLRHGMPEEIMADNGPPFGSEFIKELARYSRISLVFTPPYNPASNGIVERFMRTLRSMILIYVQQDEIIKKWDTELRLIRFVYNNMYHSSLQYSPFELVHGRTARTTILDNTIEQLPSEYRDQPTPQRHFAQQLQAKLEYAFKVIYNNQKTYFQGELPNYQANDKVMLFNTQISKPSKPRKLAYDWSGPWIITSKLSRTRLDIKNEVTNKTLKNVHVSLVKPYTQKQD